MPHIILGMENYQMELALSNSVAANYQSPSQKIRVMTEDWVRIAGFCPNCGHNLRSFERNRPVADFYCEICFEEFELKSKSGEIGKRVVDGAYSTMVERLRANNNPRFFFLTYDRSTFRVNTFLTIPKYFFVADIIERRKPLAPTARRAGWTGCNIVLTSIPELGRIFYVRNGIPRQRQEILDQWSRTVFIRNTTDLDAKGWLLDVLLCIERAGKQEFTLPELYTFEPVLKSRHPLNNNIRAKIRQQLQILRHRGIIDFVRPGHYRVRQREI